MTLLKRKQAAAAYKRALRDRDRDYQRIKETLQTRDERDEWFASRAGDIEEARVDYDQLRTSHWRNKAISKLVELPPYDWQSPNGHWQQSIVTGAVVLTDRGVAFIRTRVRQESLSSSEMFFRWAMALVAVLGILSGVATSLVRCLGNQ